MTATVGCSDEIGRNAKDVNFVNNKSVLACGCMILLCCLTVVITLSVMFPVSAPSPHFTLNDVKLYTLNLSTTLTSNLQTTISSKNEYKDTGFHFDNLDVSASYRGQQITLPTEIPPSYLNHPDVKVWSLYLNGTDVPLSPELVGSLAQDLAAGMVLINVEVTGRLSWNKRHLLHRGLRVNCPAYVMCGNGNDSKSLVRPLSFRLVMKDVKFKWDPFGHEGCDIQVG